MSNRCSASRRFGSVVCLLRRWGRAGALVAAGLALSACATQEITVITLSGVVRGNTGLLGIVPVDAMRLTRNSVAHDVTPEMQLEPGDALRTGPDTGAVVSYPGGARAYIYPNTQVRIGSIIEDLGKVFVKVTGLFKVKTSFVTAGSEGTQYWVDVRPRNEVNVVVVEDVVKLESTTGAWPTRVVRAGEQAVLSGAGPATLYAADPADIQRETDWVRAMDRLIPVKTTLSPWVIPAIIGIGVGAAIAGGGDKGSSSTNQQRQSDAARGR